MHTWYLSFFLHNRKLRPRNYTLCVELHSVIKIFRCASISWTYIVHWVSESVAHFFWIADNLRIYHGKCDRIVLSVPSVPVPVPSHHMSDVRSQISDVRFQMSDVRCQISDVRCQMSDVRCQMSDFRCQMSNVRCQMSDSRCQMSAVRCQMSDVRYQM